MSSRRRGAIGTLHGSSLHCEASILTAAWMEEESRGRSDTKQMCFSQPHSHLKCFHFFLSTSSTLSMSFISLSLYSYFTTKGVLYINTFDVE